MQEIHVKKYGEFTIIDEPVVLHDSVYIGNYVHIRPHVEVGENTEIRDYCFLAEGCKIGKNTRIMQYSNIGSDVIIGDWCFISLGVIITNDRSIQWPKLVDGVWIKEPPIIENNVKIGAGVIILAGITLGEGCQVGAGSVVTESINPGDIYVGVPAKKLDRCV